MATVPVDGLLGVGAVSLDGEPGLAVVGEVALLVDAEVQGAGAVGHGTGVRDRHAQGSGVLLDDVKALEGSGNAVSGGEGDCAVETGVDWGGLAWWIMPTAYCTRFGQQHTDEDLLVGGVTTEVGVLCARLLAMGLIWIVGQVPLTAISQDGVATLGNESEGLGQGDTGSRGRTGRRAGRGSGRRSGRGSGRGRRSDIGHGRGADGTNKAGHGSEGELHCERLEGELRVEERKSVGVDENG